tara:strand:- start:477 stop:653 length:177 start_codon:yes stop_codon:yes gene_type:complete
MKLKQAIKSYVTGEGLVRCIDKDGNIEETRTSGGITVDFVSAEYIIRIGKKCDLINKS